MLRITSAQINPTIGDITGNIARMLLDDANFQARVEAGLVQLKLANREAPQVMWVVGAPVRRTGIGKPFHNALLVLQNGEVLLQYAKLLLPTLEFYRQQIVLGLRDYAR